MNIKSNTYYIKTVYRVNLYQQVLVMFVKVRHRHSSTYSLLHYLCF